MRHDINDISATIKKKYSRWCNSAVPAIRNQAAKLIDEVKELSECVNSHNMKLVSPNAINLYNADNRSVKAYQEKLKDSTQDEVTDCLIVLLGMAGALDMDVYWWIQNKLHINKHRGYEKMQTGEGVK